MPSACPAPSSLSPSPSRVFLGVPAASLCPALCEGLSVRTARRARTWHASRGCGNRCRTKCARPRDGGAGSAAANCWLPGAPSPHLVSRRLTPPAQGHRTSALQLPPGSSLACPAGFRLRCIPLPTSLHFSHSRLGTRMARGSVTPGLVREKIGFSPVRLGQAEPPVCFS